MFGNPVVNWEVLIPTPTRDYIRLTPQMKFRTYKIQAQIVI